MRLSGRLRLGPVEIVLVLAALGLFAIFFTTTVRVGFQGGSGKPADLHIFWTAARAYLHGRNPYVSPARAEHQGDLFVYPAAMAALFAPLGWVPFAAATLIWTVAATASSVGALWLFGVRDARCYAVALVSFPLVSGITVGTLTPFLLIATAALWRWRDRPARAGLMGAFLLVSKLFLWPLVVWLVVTRRYRAAAFSVLIAGASTLLAWARIDFAGMSSYYDLLHRLTLLEGPWSYQPVWLLPGSGELRLAILEALACVGAVLVYLAGRRDERTAFRVALAVALAVSPILWAHYFTLLVPLLDGAFSIGWLLLLGFWVSRTQVPHGSGWRISAFWLLAMLSVGLSSSRSDLRGRPDTVAVEMT